MNCSHEPKRGAVINGVFQQLCDTCLGSFARTDNAALARYQRAQDRANHEGDIIQPWHDGLPNPEFIKFYPDEAAEYFTEDQLNKSGV
jgi:hypothetical protein